METHIAIVTEMRKIAATAGVLMLNDWEMALSEVQMEHSALLSLRMRCCTGGKRNKRGVSKSVCACVLAAPQHARWTVIHS